MIRLQATTSERAQDQRDSRESDRARQGYTYTAQNTLQYVDTF